MQPTTPPFNLESFFSVVTTALSVALLFTFLKRNLRKEYPIFVLYCAFDAIASTVFLGAEYAQVRVLVVATMAYVVLIARWPFEFYVVLELMDRILTDHRGLARVGRYVVLGALAIAGLSALFLVQFDAAGHPSLERSLMRLLEADRGVSICLLVFLVMIGGFLWFFPVRLSFNTKAYYWGYSLLFLFKSIGVLVLIVGGNPARAYANWLILGTEAGIQLFWLFALKQRGTTATPAFERNWSAAKQAEVLARLTKLEQNISGSETD